MSDSEMDVRKIDDLLIRKFRVKSHLKWGEFKEFKIRNRKPGQKKIIRVWKANDRLQNLIGRFWEPEMLYWTKKYKYNLNLKIFYQRKTARQVFYQDPKLYKEIQGLQDNSPTWQKLNALYVMLKLKKQLPSKKKLGIQISESFDFYTDSFSTFVQEGADIVGESLTKEMLENTRKIIEYQMAVRPMPILIPKNHPDIGKIKTDHDSKLTDFKMQNYGIQPSKYKIIRSDFSS